MSDPFAAPSGGTKLADFEGRLLLFTPQELLKNIKTAKYGEQDAVLTDFAVLDGPEAGTVYEGVKVFQKIFISELTSRIGKDRPMMLARVVTVENKRGKDEKPVWVPQQPTDEDKQVARDYLAKATAPADPFA